MQRRALPAITLLSLLSGVAALTAGCNDLGTCDDPTRGRTTVKLGSQVMYTGQAIVLRSCTAGCHSSNTGGGGRKGAPAGLDFDLNPLTPGTPIMDATGKITGVSVDPIALAGLRARQRKVFDERESIWEQIDKGLMPPGKIGEAFKDLAMIVGITYEADGKCTEGERLTTLDNAKEELRNWLACGTPVVETVSDQLPYAQPAADAGAPESASGAFAYAGQAGYQYPACSGESTGMGDGGAGATFAQVYAIFQDSDNGCTLCHGGAGAMGNFDMGLTIDTAFTKLTTGTSTCAAKPKYVVANDPANSYLLNMVDAKATRPCTKNVMPLGSNGLTAPELKTITDWINAGAPR